MRRRRSRSSNVCLGCLSAALALFVQFAPSIHALSPHESQSSCTHGAAPLHFESTGEEDSGPCPVCAHLGGGQGSYFTAPLQIEEILSVRSSSPSIQAVPESAVPDLPDSRGPPSAP